VAVDDEPVLALALSALPPPHPARDANRDAASEAARNAFKLLDIVFAPLKRPTRAGTRIAAGRSVSLRPETMPLGFK
jgi:hypothetical protein